MAVSKDMLLLPLPTDLCFTQQEQLSCQPRLPILYGRLRAGQQHTVHALPTLDYVLHGVLSFVSR